MISFTAHVSCKIIFRYIDSESGLIFFGKRTVWMMVCISMVLLSKGHFIRLFTFSGVKIDQ